MHWRMGAEQLYISPHVVAFMGGGQLLLHHSAALASYCCTTPSSSFLTALKAWPVLVHFLLECQGGGYNVIIVAKRQLHLPLRAHRATRATTTTATTRSVRA